MKQISCDNLTLDEIKRYSDDIILYKHRYHPFTNFVVKKFKEEMSDDSSRNMFENEIIAYNLLSSNKNVAKLIKVLRCDEDYNMMIIEYLGEINGLDYLDKNDKFNALFYFLAKAIESLENLKINHGDLHLNNVMIVDGTIKLFDFGLAKGPHFLPSNWGGNSVYSRTSENFVIGQDLHDFIVLYFILRPVFNVPDNLRNQLIGLVNTVSFDTYQKGIEKYETENNFVTTTDNSKTIYIGLELFKHHTKTSGKHISEIMLSYINNV